MEEIQFFVTIHDSKNFFKKKGNLVKSVLLLQYHLMNMFLKVIDVIEENGIEGFYFVFYIAFHSRKALISITFGNNCSETE